MYRKAMSSRQVHRVVPDQMETMHKVLLVAKQEIREQRDSRAIRQAAVVRQARVGKATRETKLVKVGRTAKEARVVKADRMVKEVREDRAIRVGMAAKEVDKEVLVAKAAVVVQVMVLQIKMLGILKANLQAVQKDLGEKMLESMKLFMIRNV